MNIKMDLQQILNMAGVSNVQELILKGMQSTHDTETARISQICQDNCQAVGGQPFTDIADLILEGVAVSVFVDPLDLMLVFETEEQYKQYVALDVAMQYDWRKLMAPLNQVVFYSETGTCVFISQYEPFQLAGYIEKEIGCQSSIKKYDNLRHALQLNMTFEGFIESMRALDSLARSPIRMAVYQKRQERKASLVAFHKWVKHQEEKEEGKEK